eukprot:4509389-Pyramimonas_sp.AAC.1
MRCLHATPCSDGNWQCSLTCLFWITDSRRNCRISREQRILKGCIEAIAQATAVAKTNRALCTKTTITGQHYYDEGDLEI